LEEDIYHKSDALFTSVESYFHRLNTRVKMIYILLVSFIILLFISLFFIRIPVLINSRGLIRPINENTTIKSAQSGQIDQLYYLDGEFINKGDSLLSLNNFTSKNELRFYKESLKSIKDEYSDLTRICLQDHSTFITEKYRSDFQGFCASLAKYHLQINNLNNDLSKLRKLLRDSLISVKEYEDQSLILSKTIADSSIFYNEQYYTWETQKENIRLRLFDIESKITQLKEKIKYSNIKSPITGRIQGLKGLGPESLIQENQELCKIIPDTTLIAQLFVQPHDISWIYEGIEVRLLIDSYNQQYWGALKGYCYKIPGDYSLVNDKTVFIVECQIPDPNLYYQGNRAKVSAGLSLTAQFIVSENSLWELIKGKMQQIILP
jgi:membrane fusion protein, peptide pheromone/bacteriocin exporter